MNTRVQDLIAQYGVENIFMVGQDYHGRHEDDTCQFTYYNNVTGEFETDYWTTAAACSNFQNYECTWLWQAFENNTVDKIKFYRIMLEKEINRINKMGFNPRDFLYFTNREILASLNLKVTVNGGRKFRGSGYLVGFYDKTYQYATPQFHNRYYGDNGFGKTTTTYAKIFVPEKNMIEYATIKFVNFDELEQFYEDYKKYLLSKIYSTNEENIKFEHTGCSLTYENIPFIKYLEMFKKNNITMPEYVKDEIEEKKNEKFNKFREEKMPVLIEWVKNNTDKKGEQEIYELAEKIFNKKYSNNK